MRSKVNSRHDPYLTNTTKHLQSNSKWQCSQTTIKLLKQKLCSPGFVKLTFDPTLRTDNNLQFRIIPWSSLFLVDGLFLSSSFQTTGMQGLHTRPSVASHFSHSFLCSQLEGVLGGLPKSLACPQIWHLCAFTLMDPHGLWLTSCTKRVGGEFCDGLYCPGDIQISNWFLSTDLLLNVVTALPTEKTFWFLAPKPPGIAAQNVFRVALKGCTSSC